MPGAMETWFFLAVNEDSHVALPPPLAVRLNGFDGHDLSDYRPAALVVKQHIVALSSDWPFLIILGAQITHDAAVLVGDEATLKRVFLSAAELRLKAENPEYEDMVYRPSDNETPQILGLYRGILRTPCRWSRS